MSQDRAGRAGASKEFCDSKRVQPEILAGAGTAADGRLLDVNVTESVN